uniref:Uncharacterized protein n=1 Tax=Glossina austeni TaxID=7395 RepID=A0A1A9V1Z3_GLOAU
MIYGDKHISVCLKLAIPPLNPIKSTNFQNYIYAVDVVGDLSLLSFIIGSELNATQTTDGAAGENKSEGIAPALVKQLLKSAEGNFQIYGPRVQADGTSLPSILEVGTTLIVNAQVCLHLTNTVFLRRQ